MSLKQYIFCHTFAFRDGTLNLFRKIRLGAKGWWLHPGWQCVGLSAAETIGLRRWNCHRRFTNCRRSLAHVLEFQQAETAHQQ